MLAGDTYGTSNRYQAGSLIYMDIDFRGGVQAGDRNESTVKFRAMSLLKIT